MAVSFIGGGNRSNTDLPQVTKTLYHMLQGSTLTVVRLPGASEMHLRASENGTQLVRSGK
jgi:hypothetical protein